MSERKAFDLEERLIAFTVRVISVVESLPATRAGNQVAGQLVRCGSSPAPNYAEAQAAESRSDFIHKMKVCLKGLRETRVWLLIAQRKPLVVQEIFRRFFSRPQVGRLPYLSFLSLALCLSFAVAARSASA